MKRLVICADGTWNFRDQIDDETRLRHATNVAKVARAILPQSRDGTPQVVIYHEGVGTRAGLDRVAGGAFGAGLQENIRQLYRSIIYNYVLGDELFFFGFSRGAFTVRALTGFAKQFGLLNKEDDFFVPDLYHAHTLKRTAADVRKDVRFKRLGHANPCPPIKFMGVWDTVSALGWPGKLGPLARRKRPIFHDVELGPHIENAYQALAIDEQRVPFAPILWSKPTGWEGTLKQVWFTGVHCNCGGGYSPDGLANEALHWIVEQAESHGLEFNSPYLSYFKPCFNSKKHDSMKPYYRVLGRLVRPIGSHLESGEAIHQSVIDRLKDDSLGYKADNLNAALKSNPLFPVASTTRIKRGKCAPNREKPNALS